MKKFLIGGVSLFAILSASNAFAAGYTCEELIEYTSCNDGYYLNAGDCIEGSTCGAGNYLNGTCPDGYAYSDGWCFGGEWASSMSKEECEDSGETWYGAGCVRDDGEDTYHWDETAFNPSAFSTLCIPCDAGTYQPSAGQYSCITCPAGSECPTTTAATLCESGEYSNAGATACSTCPTHSYTNASGQTVSVSATSLAGAAGATACYIDPDTYFTDVTGTYHFKEKCIYDNSTYYEPSAAEISARSCDRTGYVLAYDMPDEEKVWLCHEVTRSECISMAETLQEDYPDDNTEGVITWNETKNICECSLGWEYVGTVGVTCPF